MASSGQIHSSQIHSSQLVGGPPDTHYVVDFVIRKVDREKPSSENQVKLNRDVHEVSRIMIKSATLPELVNKICQHAQLLRED